MVFDGKFTHAILKKAKPGDFRVQDDHGGIVTPHTATIAEIEFAEKCIKNCPYNPLYARVDIVYDNNKKLSLSELELIEPELWFRNNKHSVKKMANVIFKKITQ